MNSVVSLVDQTVEWMAGMTVVQMVANWVATTVVHWAAQLAAYLAV